MIGRRRILVRQDEPGAIADERHGLGRELFARCCDRRRRRRTAATVAGVAVGVAAGDGGVQLLLAAAIASERMPASPVLVKYRKPPTPIATRHTSVTATGHIQFGAAAAWQLAS